MPRIDLGEPYDHYVQQLINSGLFSTYTEVVKDALRQHMDKQNGSKFTALMRAAILEGEKDIHAGRVDVYSPELIDSWTQEVLKDG